MADPPPPLTLRDARDDDAATLVAFNQALALESEGRTLAHDVVDRGVRRLLADPDRGRYVVAVVFAAGHERIVGQLMLTREWSDWRDGWFLWIQSVYVDPSFRRRGVYRALHAHVLAQLQAPAPEGERIRGVRLYVEPDNERAKQTYAALGMTITYDVMEQSA